MQETAEMQLELKNKLLKVEKIFCEKEKMQITTVISKGPFFHPLRFVKT